MALKDLPEMDSAVLLRILIKDTTKKEKQKYLKPRKIIGLEFKKKMFLGVREP